MAPMVNVRAVPTAWRWAAVRGEHHPRRSIRTIQTRGIATNAAIREPGAEVPGGVPPVAVPQRQSALEKRIAAVDKAKPFSDFLTDTFNRQHDYLRISITERCNLRCLYCMPEEGIPLSPAEHMLTTPEIFYLSSLFVSQGVTKIRLTGGEPTVRRDIVPMMQQIGSLRANGLKELALTTNGIALHRKLDAMVESGLTGINLSLDTLDPFQFQIMTRRNGFDAVMKSINRILEMNKLGANVKLKVNCVVMRGLNEREILPFVEMGREKEIEVRFIEYMPFGGNKWSQGKMISFQEMLDIIRTKYPDLRPVPGHKNDTSKTYEVPGFVGKVGFITSMTNDFCGTCNRLRITSDGNLKVCLHGNAEVSLRDVLRQGNDGRPIDQEAFERIKQLEMDRHEGRLSEETILGWGQRERELLDVIGTAVKRKAEKHADMGDLENMTNRPMILIDEPEHLPSLACSSEHPPHILRTIRASESARKNLAISPVSPLSFLSATPSHNVAARRAYSSGTNTHRRGDNLPLLNSKEVGSADLTRPFSAGKRKKRRDERADTNSRAAEVASLESGGLNSPTFAKHGVRRVQDQRNAPFFPLTRHLDLDHLKDTDIVPTEHDVQSVQQNLHDAIEQQPEQEVPEQDLRKEQAQDLLDAEEQALLRAVWQHGAEKAPLPKYLETIRRKYKMDSLDYRFYWRYVAGSLMTPRISGAYDKARNFLRRLEKGKGTKHVILAEDGEEKNLSLHLRLMIEAKRSRKKDKENEDRKRKGESGITNVDSSAALVAETEQIYTGMGKDAASTRIDEAKNADLEALVMAMPKVREELTALGIGDAAELAAVPEEKQKMNPRQERPLREQWVEIQMKRRAIIEERVSRLAKKQMRAADAVQELERQREIRERKADVKIKIQNLVEVLATEEEKQREAEEAREEAYRLAEERTQRREGLDHVLDDALARAGLHEDLAGIIPTRNEIISPVLRPKLNQLVSHQTPTRKAGTEDEAKQVMITSAPSPSAEHIKSLSGRAGPGDIFIDPSLTLKLNADTKDLQRQIQKLEGRLSASYPRMDAMPYVISLSENRNTLQTWLRILGKRLKSRDDNAGEWSEEKIEVKAVLDQMVRDHDLNNEAARRMAKRWEDIVQKRTEALDDVYDGGELDMEEVDAAEEVRLAAQEAELDVETTQSTEETVLGTEVDEELDMDEFDAGGMSFLSVSEVEKEVGVQAMGSDVSAEQQVPLATQNIERDTETAESAEEVVPSAEVEEELELVAMDAVTDKEAKVNAQSKGSHAEKRAKVTANPLITPSRKDTDSIDNLIAKRLYSTSSRPPLDPTLVPSTSTPTTGSSPSTSPAESMTTSSTARQPSLPHLTSSGSAHMVSVSAKAHTVRTAIAVGTVHFSNPTPLSLISSASLKKGDVLAVSRIAGIMAAKKCPDLIPLCHPIPLTHVGVELRVLNARSASIGGTRGGGEEAGEFGGVTIEAKVQCTGPTGVEMEALTAVMGAALSVVDMCKAVDKFQRVQDVRVVLKEGGKSGVWREEGWRSSVHDSGEE